MQELVAVRGARPLGRQADHEPLDVTPEMQQHPLAGEIDRGNLNPVPRLDEDESVVRQAGSRPDARAFD